ncbi:SsrA-binding protein SmpB [Magnetospirillum gryphiswaldense]|uniref:SsrA-binding protein n=2 Tax=Magnetospirillum gryphiswaldense TaxID=55518 RepID=V6EYJ8_MAGGM|nr:SsrA-binding protein SmpB [Magnetospirillum gryphiswaldense]KAF0222405.1 MAG: SsrA-binding [Rhodospirillaceae bacterium]TNC98238.1 MAG: SsrA-binding protein [Stygiobacter sp.]AVM73728.1 SsrA-binding protein [Magnetospirillum gryphiswaldense MSR-1]AVM77631.1 SsrA-binding protein [Magnetospirillum gryphiswaldense]CAM76784.1 SmpB protein [Magnetospirillum gryphiswaldense MSR-1]
MSLPERIAAQNRKARHEYTIVDTIEAGIMLVGTEIKSLRAGKGNISEAFAGPNGDELILYNAYIPEYQAKMPFPHETRRPRKLLLHRRELRKLVGAIAKDGMTLVPLDIHFNNRGIAKVQLGLAKGRKAHDKREAIKQRDWNREKARVLRNRD